MPQENNVPHEWSAEGLLDEIQKLDTTMKDRSLAFILGAGASITSGIPAGGALAQTWLKEIHLRQCLTPSDQALEAWAAEKLNVPNFRLAEAATHYSRIFELRFGGDPKSGYAALEAEMEKAEPGLGYSILAKILAETRHKVVVTTNFDNLVADALAINALQHPLIVGHESLAGFVRPQLPRPLVAKIHRDLHLHPKNDQNGVDTLEKGWEEALRGLFQHYTPLVIGYGGNDGSLMGFLENLPSGHIPGRLFWCYREGARPDETILKILVRHNGVLVAVAGFDEFMVQLAQRLFAGFELASIAQSIEELGKERAKRYQAQLEQLAKADITPRSPTADKARKSISAASHDDSKWWTWELRARAENDPDKRDAIYREAVSHLPNRPELAGNYAIFLKNQRKDYDAAEAMYKKALELDPNDADYTANFASLLLSKGDAVAIQQVEPLIRKVIDISGGRPSQSLAEALLYRCLHSELSSGTPGNGIGCLKSLLSMDFERKSWDFSAVFESVLPKICSDRQSIYRAIGDAILNAESLPALDEFPLWHDTPSSDPFVLG